MPCSRARLTSTRAVPCAEWRAGDSIWALVEAAELAEVERKLRDLHQRGELEAYVAEHDAMRPQIGQITLLYGIRR